MIRATIYIEKQVWQEIREDAHEKWISPGKYIVELYESIKVNKGSKVNKPETPEKIEEMPKPIKYEAPSSTGGVQFKPCPKGGK